VVLKEAYWAGTRRGRSAGTAGWRVSGMIDGNLGFEEG
jgi:hypothetical protein